MLSVTSGRFRPLDQSHLRFHEAGVEAQASRPLAAGCARPGQLAAKPFGGGVLEKKQRANGSALGARPELDRRLPFGGCTGRRTIGLHFPSPAVDSGTGCRPHGLHQCPARNAEATRAAIISFGVLTFTQPRMTDRNSCGAKAGAASSGRPPLHKPVHWRKGPRRDPAFQKGTFVRRYDKDEAALRQDAEAQRV